jgi:hypothetical protein
MFNLDLAVSVLTHIELTREGRAGGEWAQDSWGVIYDLNSVDGDVLVDEETNTVIGYGTCGTAMCFAGWALTLSRVKMLWEAGGPQSWIATRTADGDEIPDRAARLLGINREDHDLWDDDECMPRMFLAHMSLDDLYELVAEHAGVTVEHVQKRVETEKQDVLGVPAKL